MRLRLLPQLFNDVLTRRPLQPLGLLYLERLVMTPVGVDRGELAYSLPLAPNEKVTLAHREWSVHEEQFSEFIEDFLENFSEKGVAENNDIAISYGIQTSHNNSLSMNQPVSSTGSVQVTNPLDTTKNASVDDTIVKKESQFYSREVTSLASKRTIKDHKISFTVTTVSGMEDFTAHLIENKHEDKSMRIDYYKRVRNWKSDLYRYGVRLTYDVVLPDPGGALRDREEQLQRIAEELSTEFQFYLLESEITINNWRDLADHYGVVLSPPPDYARHIETTESKSYPSPKETHHNMEQLSVMIPEGFRLENLNIFAQTQAWLVNNYGGWVTAYVGQTGNRLLNKEGLSIAH